jgi:hypothetical protein
MPAAQGMCLIEQLSKQQLSSSSSSSLASSIQSDAPSRTTTTTMRSIRLRDNFLGSFKINGVLGSDAVDLPVIGHWSSPITLNGEGNNIVTISITMNDLRCNLECNLKFEDDVTELSMVMPMEVDDDDKTNGSDMIARPFYQQQQQVASPRLKKSKKTQ